MRKSTKALKGFLTAHFFRHSAGIAVFMLFTLSLMSFRYDTKVIDGKHSNKRDSVNALSNNFSGLLTGDLTEEPIADRSVFTVKSTVADFIADYAKKEKEEYNNMKDWGKPYFELYNKILTENGLPVELKYLSVIESSLQNTNITGGKAVGPWQLMPYEGKRFGLSMKKSYDERTNYTKSTQVAASLLKELYSEFGDWLLVIAAYNCGMGRVKKAISQAGSSNYWALEQYLPKETKNHVKKYIATHYFFEGGGGWTTVTASDAEKCRVALAKINEAKNMVSLSNFSTSEITGKYNSAAIIQSIAIDAELFNKLNPGFDKTVADGKPYSLKLPQNKMPMFITNRRQILEQSIQLQLSASHGS